MSGFDNDICFAKNADFTKADNQSVSEGNGLATDGQLWIGTTSVNAGGTHINVGALTSPDSSVNIGYSSPNITLQVAGGSTTIKTVTGNTGGAIAPVAGNFNFLTANSTVVFAGTAGTETLDFGITNLILGNSASSITTATGNVGFGRSVFTALTSAQQNTCVGLDAGVAITIGDFNTAIGSRALSAATSSTNNVAVGLNSLKALSTGSGSNTAIGYSSLSVISTGTNNIAIGYLSGANCTGSDSSNIHIGHAGNAGENNTIRIGTSGSGAGQQNRAFLAGVTGVTVASSAPIAVDANGQLSSLGTGSLGQVLTSTGTTSPTWQAPNPNALTFTNTTATTLAVNNGYFATAAGTYNMPATAAQGDLLIVFCDTAGAVVLDCPASNFIRIGNSITSSGGTITSTAQGDSVTLRYRLSSLTWCVVSSMGNWTVA